MIVVKNKFGVSDMRKKTVMIIMCIAILFMIVGYAAFSANLNINGTANIASTWQVLFTKIEEVSKSSGVTIKSAPTASGTTATFNLDVQFPGDTIVYKITVENQGTIDAIINDITASKAGNDAIKFNITGIKKGDVLTKGTSTTFNVEITYDINTTKQPTDLNEALTMEINYIQYAGQDVPSEDIMIKSRRLGLKILNDNTALPDTNIDFSQISSDTNGKGLYYTSTNTEDNKVTYYFRGAVENNYVKFANELWRIIRINEDGSVRLIKQVSLEKTEFNETATDNAHVGYMFGTAGSTTYEETHKNINSSTIKSKIDTWYQNNLINYSSVIADAGFCGDRTIAPTAKTWNASDTALGYGSNFTVYGALARLMPVYGPSGVNPEFKCPQENDLYTTITSDKGNKALTYPVGLITADEVIYAGIVNDAVNDTCYLHIGVESWTMSPSYSGAISRMWYVGGNGSIGYGRITYEWFVRPVINMKSTVEITSGDGTEISPYVIKTN